MKPELQLQRFWMKETARRHNNAQGYVALNGKEGARNPENQLTPSSLPRSIIAITLIVLALSAVPAHSQVATAGLFSPANDSVNNAFSSIYYAEQNGGDVSVLVVKLNTAISLIQNARAENNTNPNAANADLSNATTIAQMVSLTSTSVSSSGSMARQLRVYESLGTIAATVCVAALAYLRGDRVYRRLWLYVYRNHVVKENDE
jgi:hypothetical protein